MAITRRGTIFGLGAASFGLNALGGTSFARAAPTISSARPEDDFYLYADAADKGSSAP